MSSSTSSSLRPAWKGGSKGFQPPPTVASERTKKIETNHEPVHSVVRRDMNAFAALDDEEDAAAAAALSGGNHSNNHIRSDALRGSGATASSTATASGKSSGRSLSELAARAPTAAETQARGGGGAAGRFERMRSDSNVSEGNLPKVQEQQQKVIRFTRERLLSMRPAPLSEPPQTLKELFGNAILSEEGQDPVCWDNFDADAIWATQPRRTSKIVAAAPGMSLQPLDEGGLGARRAASGGRREGSGRWERGVALPTADQVKKQRDANNADELWDDPVSASGGAAMDFSAFGAPPSDEPFDFDRMAEASRELERELHGDRARANSIASRTDSEADDTHLVKIDPARPLATVGTTIRSGSGDDVNVFEDFGEPIESDINEQVASLSGVAVKAGAEDATASSRLMDMIGVKRDELPGLNLSALAGAENKTLSPWDISAQQNAIDGPSISLNPWGTSLLPTVQNDSKGLDMNVLSELEEQKRRSDELRRRQEEETQRRIAQQQAEERSRQAQMQQQQQPAVVQSQVETVLLERTTTILENSWGRSDLPSILSTLHAEDTRVIPILSSVDALRALLLRNPRRITVRHDASFGAEMAILNMTNAQWQQQHQQDNIARQQEEERRRREEQELQKRRQAAVNAIPSIVPDAPWYYSDPQGNIQGPFRSNEMRQWLEAGYFKGDLPISQQQSGPFRPLQMLFPDLDNAFAAPGKSAAEIAREEMEEKARREAEQRARIEAQEAAEREQRARFAREEAVRLEQERLAKEDARRREDAAFAAAAAASAPVANGGSDSSSQQLKMMLGMPTNEQETSEPVVEKKTKERKAVPPSAKAVKEAPKAAPAAPPAPAWGTTPSPKTNAKTLAEIQKEEARRNAVLAMQQQKPGASSSGWANVAAARGGSTAWQSGSVKPTAAAVLTKASSLPVPSSRERQQSSGDANSRQSLTIQHQNSTSSAAEEFGAKMSPALEKWCLDQMMKLNGTDDLTLVSFCMTLNNASEIRQYLTAYLGSTPPVNNFATEFINKRGLGAPVAQEEWESTAQVKKARKKKGAK